MTSTNQMPATERFIDANFGEWYDQGLPPALRSQASRVALPAEIEDFAGMEIPNFEQTLTNTLVQAEEPNPYHNATHAQRAVVNTLEGYDGLCKLTGWNLPDGFLQPVFLGTAAHDHGHPGTTFFADAPENRLPNGLSREEADAMAVEWYSAKSASEVAVAAGATAAQQFVAAYIPASSVYGANSPHGERLRLNRITNGVRGIAGLMMRVADVAQPREYVTNVAEDTAVIIGEGLRRPATLTEYDANRIGFLKHYVLPTFDALDAAVQVELTEHLGWRGTVMRRLGQIDEMSKGNSPVLRAVLRAQSQVAHAHELA